MRKTISPILMFLLTLLGGASAWADATWYSPGSRLSIEDITEGSLNGLSISSAPSGGAWDSGTKWYSFRINSNYIETTPGYCDESDKLLANKSATSSGLGALWAVVGDEENGFQFYNLTAGPGKVLGLTGSEAGARCAMVDASNAATNVTTRFDITYQTDGWYIKKHGEANNYLNYRDGYLALWDSSAGLGNPGSKVLFTEIPDLSAYVTAAHTTLVNRVNYWKKVPAIWENENAAATYRTLSTYSLPDPIANSNINEVVAKHSEIGTAFINAVANKRFTAKNGEATTTHARYGKYMYVSSDNRAKGHTPTYTLDEVMTIKPNKDLTFKIYNERVQKYIGTPGGNTAVGNFNNAGNFDIYTVESGVDKVVFCNNGVATMHLLGGLEISNWSDKEDPASFWVLNTEISGNELNQVITDARTWKTNLETFCNGQANIIVQPKSLTTIGTAITTAQDVFNNQSATEDDLKDAKRTLQAVYDKAKVSWLGELGSIQRFRLRNNAITTSTTNYYLTMGLQKDDNNEGNARVMDDTEGAGKQIFTLIPSGDKYIIKSNGKQLTDLGFWNTDMTNAGTPYVFEEVDLANGLFRIRTTQGLLGPNSGVTGSNITENKKAYIYTNHNDTRANLTWALELVAPNVTGKDNLQATLNAQTWTTTHESNIINPEEVPCLQQYLTQRTVADDILENSNDQAAINAAQVNLEVAYSELLHNFITQAAATQSYRLKYKCNNDYYMTITPGVTETNEVNVMTVTSKNPSKTQIFRLIPATGENAGKFYIKECATNKYIHYGTNSWNPSLSETQGILFTPEYTTLEGVYGIVLRLKNSKSGSHTDKYLSPSSANPAKGAYAYTDQNGGSGASSFGYWIIEPTDLIPTLNSQIERAQDYETHLGSGLNQYSNTADWDNETLSSNNDKASAYANSTGTYEGQQPTNTGLQTWIDKYTNFLGGISINQPEVRKLYRFKCVGNSNGNRLTSDLNGSSNMTTGDNAGNLQKSIFYLTADNRILSYATGLFVGEYNGSKLRMFAAGEAGATVSFADVYSAYGRYPGAYSIRLNNRNIYGAGDEVDSGRDTEDRDGYFWTIEEVQWLPISVTNEYSQLGTFVSPVDLKAASGEYSKGSRLKFYTGTIGTDSYFHVKEYTEDVIPANTPFLIEYQDGSQHPNDCSYLEISNTNVTFDREIDNDLQGGLVTVTRASVQGNNTIYTLQKNTETNTQEFWVYNGTNIKGFRAYLSVPAGAQIRGMIFGGQTTDIESATTETAAPVIYDLSGRRVQHATKGMYIVNGKKMYVK